MPKNAPTLFLEEKVFFRFNVGVQFEPIEVRGSRKLERALLDLGMRQGIVTGRN
jgi:hypothetical protein